MTITNALQTNGTHLTPEWCDFFREEGFLIGISVDGPATLHDRYRVSKGGQPTHAAVLGGLELLRAHRVEFDILTTVHATNAQHPQAVYRHLRDELQADYMQFIPIVVPAKSGNGVEPSSVTGDAYGRFLIGVFDEWLQGDVGRVSVQIFETSLASWMGLRPGLCVFEETCGTALAMEHNGDLFSCDHFVDPEYYLGNAASDDLRSLVESPRQTAFGNAKRDRLPQYCRECNVRFACNGGCPKNRIACTLDGELGLNHLCSGYRMFFNRIDQPMRLIAAGIQRGVPMPAVQQQLLLYWENMTKAVKQSGRNDPCPCGSGLKAKKCHG
jgi:uncharacterized protein